MKVIDNLVSLEPKKTTAKYTKLGSIKSFLENWYKGFGQKYELASNIDSCHIIFNPIDEYAEHLMHNELEGFGRPVPTDYVSFLKQYNGLYLFSGSINLFGYVPAAERVPTDDPDVMLANLNIVSRNYKHNETKDPKSKYFTVGYVCGNQLFYPKVDNKQLYMFNQQTRDFVKFSGIEGCLNYCVPRLAKHYNSKGIVDRPMISGSLVSNRFADFNLL